MNTVEAVELHPQTVTWKHSVVSRVHTHFHLLEISDQGGRDIVIELSVLGQRPARACVAAPAEVEAALRKLLLETASGDVAPEPFEEVVQQVLLHFGPR